MAVVAYGIVAIFGGVIAAALVAPQSLAGALIVIPLAGSLLALMAAALVSQDQPTHEASTTRQAFIESPSRSILALLGSELRERYDCLLNEPFPDAISRPLRALAARDTAFTHVG